MSYILKVEQKGIVVRKKGISIDKALCISFDFQITEVQSNPQNLNGQEFNAILGIKVIRNIPFFIIVKQSESICTFQGSQIFEIKAIDWIPIVKDIHSAAKSEIIVQLDRISKLFEQGMHYYSDYYQLHKPFLLNNRKTTIEEENYYKQFIWNRRLIKIDIQNEYMKQIYGKGPNTKQNYQRQSEIFKKWCTPMIQGYVDSFEGNLPGHLKIPYLLISRRSNRKAGTRFFSRGIDDEGNVANYTESEQIIQFNNKVCTHLQLRGSVPVFFEQVGVQGINIQLNIKRSKQLTRKTFKQHFNVIKAQYERVLCVNLLTEHKKSEKKLIQFFQEMLQDFNQEDPDENNFVKYQFFDFHQQCKNNQFNNSSILIHKLEGIIEGFGYNIFERSSKSILKTQSGIFRTNCLDCLDRTNYVQSRIALYALQKIVMNNVSVQIYKAITMEKIFAQIQLSKNSQFLNNFNKVWAQNGDAVSLHYTGIGSTHTDITKTGKRTLFGTVNHKMRSLMRFYTQFTDIEKHETINNFLGNKSLLNISDQFTLEVNQQNDESFLPVSWQFTCPEQSLDQFQKRPHDNKIYKFLKDQMKNTHPFTIIVLNLYIPNKLINWQSMNLKKLNLFSRQNVEKDVITRWGQFITSQLQGKQYVLIDKNSNDYNQLLIFCRKEKINSISNIKNDDIGSSLKTNESVLLTKFFFNKSSLVFQAINVKNLDNFIEYLQKAQQKGFQYKNLGKSKSSNIDGQSYKLILGNIGSKNLQKYSEEQITKIQDQIQQILDDSSPSRENSLYQLIQKGYENDQFKVNEEKYFNKSKILMNYNEPLLEFIPNNNRIMFWNQCGKIGKANKYRKVREMRNLVCIQNCVSCDLIYEIGQHDTPPLIPEVNVSMSKKNKQNF